MWTAAIQITSSWTTIAIKDEGGNELLKAQLPYSRHPRALLTLLEGMALWSGQAIHGAISADGWDQGCCDEFRCLNGCRESLWGLDVWPAASALVEIDFLFEERFRTRLADLEGAGGGR